ncbi:hypothetical protein [Tenacibaculum agarivorans]|uniref:hypothetical protein n=1 Tax=Tenacibaculum agarivorans TaxID=1908389 RepID=UPI00094BC4E2|nr:hypothetical protein [Tenacibaculum agarivorans]
MKTKGIQNFTSSALIAIMMLISLSSCQEEKIEIKESQDTLKADSTIVNLMVRTVTNDGSIDNIIDKANCLEIKLPVTVIVNNVELIVENVDGYATIEGVFDQFSTDQDKLEVQFPITVIQNDYSELRVNNELELEELKKSCNGENEEDDDIECIDFEYPLTVSVFNISNSVTNTQSIEDDKQFYQLLTDIDDLTSAAINFPINLKLHNGEKITVNSNKELEEAIEGAMNGCDEDDDFDFDDDDEISDYEVYCNAAALTEKLKQECGWSVYETTESSITNFGFKFDSNFTFKIVDPVGGQVGIGTWEIEDLGLNKAKVLKLRTNPTNQFEDYIQGDWVVEGCSPNSMYLYRGNDLIIITGNCAPDINAVAILLINCTWDLPLLKKQGVDLSIQFSDFHFEFLSSGLFIFTNGVDSYQGAWGIDDVGGGNIVVAISSAELPQISDYYLVTSIKDDKIDLLGTLDSQIILSKRECK